MKKKLFHTILAVTAFGAVVIIGIIFIQSIGKYSSIVAIKNLPSVTATYLDGSTLRFDCLDTSKCFTDVDLGAKVKAAYQNEFNPHLGFAYYDENGMLYMLIEGSFERFLVKVDPRTGQVQILDPTPFLEGLSPGGMAIMIQDKLVMATVDGKISIVQDDFSVKTIDIKAPIQDIIETFDSWVAAISANSLLQNGKSQVKVFLVDVNTSHVEEVKIANPQEGDWWLLTVDQAIQHLYWLPNAKVLKAFDLAAQKDVLSVPLSDGDSWTYTTMTAKRYQYHDIWYYSRRILFSERPYPAMMVDMSTLKPIVSQADFLSTETDPTTFMVSPFGDNFLIGTDSHVFMVTPAGKVVKTYAFPEGKGRDYLLPEYRR
jgi:hypothetical protein